MTNHLKKQIWVGFDLGGTKITATIYDSRFGILSQDKQKTKAQEGAEKGLQRVILTIRNALLKAQVKESDIAGIGIGFPGPIDYEKGQILAAPNLGWSDFNLVKRLKKVFQCPVSLLNDVDAGLYGEYRFGAAKGAHCALGIFIGTGIGGACIYEGRIFRGRQSSCFEIGHLPVSSSGPLCGCGKKGCLEAYSSRLAISAEAAKAVYRGQAPHLLEIAGMDISDIRSNALASSIKAGDKVIESIVREASASIGQVAAGLVNLLLPDVIILGGGVVEAMPKLICQEVLSSMKKRVMPAFDGSFQVLPASLGDNAASMGAAAWVQQEKSTV